MSRHVLRRPSILVPLALAILAGCHGDAPTAPSRVPTPHFAQGDNGVWTVNTLADPGGGICDDTECTFREAVASASNGHSIVFAAGLQGEILLVGGAVAISSKSVTVDGGGRIAVNAQGLSRAINVVSSSGPVPEVTIKRLTVKNGFENVGGGIRVSRATVTLDSVFVTGNQAAVAGAGIDVDEGNVTIRNSIITGNTSASLGGGIEVNLGGALSVIASEISGNTAPNGGAIHAFVSTVTISRSTISSNTATVGTGGVFSKGTVVVRSSTITRNSGTEGGLNLDPGGSANIANSILAGNTGTTANDCGVAMGAGSGGHNLMGTDCAPAGTGDMVVTAATLFADVLESTLKNNGGPTKTHALFPRGQAVDKGDCPGETLDQRGARRPVDDAGIANAGNACDIGAYEVQGGDLMVSQTVDKTSVKQGDLLTYSVRVQNLGPDAAPNVVLTDMLSSGVTFVEARVNKGAVTAPPKGETGAVTWNLGTMVSQANEVASIQVTVLVKGKTTVTNTTSVKGDIADPNDANNSAAITVSVAPGGTAKKR
jgi:uncharacterized repeat protein (TIGR01451 family)